jgi:hypothetical protein
MKDIMWFVLGVAVIVGVVLSALVDAVKGV